MRDGGDHREDACPELQSGSEGDDTEDEVEADEESEGRIRSTEMECEGQLAEGCSQKELRSGEAHPLLARSDDADFLPFRSAGAMVPMGLAVKKPVCGLKGCARLCHEKPAHEGGYFQYCGRTHGTEAVRREYIGAAERGHAGASWWERTTGVRARGLPIVLSCATGRGRRR